MYTEKLANNPFDASKKHAKKNTAMSYKKHMFLLTAILQVIRRLRGRYQSLQLCQWSS